MPIAQVNGTEISYEPWPLAPPASPIHLSPAAIE